MENRIPAKQRQVDAIPDCHYIRMHRPDNGSPIDTLPNRSCGTMTASCA